jgi:integrase/recombinase XerC
MVPSVSHRQAGRIAAAADGLGPDSVGELMHLLAAALELRQLRPHLPAVLPAVAAVTSHHAWSVIRADLLHHRRRAATIRAHRYVWFAFCASLGPRKRLHRITERDLDRFLERPTQDARGVRQLSAATQRTYASIVCGAYRRLTAAGQLRHNPLAGYVLPPVAEGPPRDLPDQTVAALLELAARDERDLLVLLLAWGQGLRIGSISSARIEDVDLRGNGSMFVRAKGGRTGQIPLADPVGFFLRGYLAGRPRAGPLVANRGAGQSRRHLSADHVGRLLRRLLRAAGCPARPHDLRHTFATTLLAERNGENIRAVSQLMLHAKLSSTQRYTKGFTRDAWDTIRLLKVPQQRQPSPGSAGEVAEPGEDRRVVRRRV